MNTAKAMPPMSDGPPCWATWATPRASAPTHPIAVPAMIAARVLTPARTTRGIGRNAMKLNVSSRRSAPSAPAPSTIATTGTARPSSIAAPTATNDSRAAAAVRFCVDSRYTSAGISWMRTRMTVRRSGRAWRSDIIMREVNGFIVPPPDSGTRIRGTGPGAESL